MCNRAEGLVLELKARIAQWAPRCSALRRGALSRMDGRRTAPAGKQKQATASSAFDVSKAKQHAVRENGCGSSNVVSSGGKAVVKFQSQGAAVTLGTSTDAAGPSTSPLKGDDQELSSESEPYMRYKSIGCVSRHNGLRRAARRLTRAPWFDRTIDVCIVINCVSLALRSPSPEAGSCSYAPDPAANAVLLVLDATFTAIFCAESLLKMLVYGVIGHPGAYLRDGWNCIDFSVAVVSFLAQLPLLCETVCARCCHPSSRPSLLSVLLSSLSLSPRVSSSSQPVSRMCLVAFPLPSLLVHAALGPQRLSCRPPAAHTTLHTLVSSDEGHRASSNRRRP